MHCVITRAVNSNDTMYAVNSKFSILFGVGNFKFKTGNIHSSLEHFENRLI